MEAVTGEREPAPVSAPERALIVLAVIGLFAMAALITTNVVSRWLGHSIIPDDVLLVQELMVPVILLPLGVVTALRQHIAVEVFTDRLSDRAKDRLAMVSHVVGLAFGAFLLWAATRSLLDSWASQDYYNGVLHIPMWLGHATFVLGIALFIVRLVIMLVAGVRGTGGGHPES